MAKRYVVNLTSEERSTLEKLVNTGRASAKKQIHARILLKADISAEGPGWSDRQICEALEASSSCVERVRKRLVEEGLEAALNRRPSSRPSSRRLDGEQEARLVWPAALLPKGMGLGPYACWPTRWSLSSTWSRSPMRPCAGH